SVAFSPDNGLIASGSEDKTAHVRDVLTGADDALPFKYHVDTVMTIAFSPDGTCIVTGGGPQDMNVIVWHALTGSVVAGPFHGHTSRITSAIFSPDGTRVISGSYDKSIRIWDTRTGRNATRQPNPYEASIGPIAFLPDCSQFVSVSSSGALQVWDVHTGAIIPGLLAERTKVGPIKSVAFSPKGTHIAASADNFNIWVWVMRGGTAFSTPLQGHQGLVNTMSFSPDGTHICSGSDDTTLIIWDICTSAKVGQPYRGHTGSVRSLTYSVDGTRLASGAADSTVRVWDTSTGGLIHTLSEHAGIVESVAFSPDSNYLVSGGTDGSIHKWDVHTGTKCGGLFEEHNELIHGEGLDGDDDQDDWAVLLRLSDPSAAYQVSFSPDGAHIVAGSGDTIHVFDAQVGTLISVLSTPENERYPGFHKQIPCRRSENGMHDQLKIIIPTLSACGDLGLTTARRVHRQLQAIGPVCLTGE
ncbi:hypothetical protein FRC11_011556, partial [Ceratobasidium sp. 423]